jgi:hypothetical protein
MELLESDILGKSKERYTGEVRVLEKWYKV